MVESIRLIGREIKMFYQLDKVGCPKGYAYVKDFKGNRCFYGTIAECEAFIDQMERELYV